MRMATPPFRTRPRWQTSTSGSSRDCLKLAHPRKAEVSFVMGRARKPHVVHIYLGKGGHWSMTVSVAAGSRTDDSLAYGVAPNARVLLVRVGDGSDRTTASVFEGFIAAAQRPDVDVISSSTGLFMVPDTAADFGGGLMRRVVGVYQKPIVVSAANSGQMLAYVYALGSVLSVGGVLSPATYASLHGGRALEQLIVHPTGAAGPSIDGMIKPDLLAPMERLAAILPWQAEIDAVPRNAPTRRIPPGYQIGCCTSSTAPYAAGVIALLASAAKQSGVPVNADGLYRALKSTARLVPGFQPHQQGNGAIDINAAWLELTRPRVDPAAHRRHRRDRSPARAVLGPRLRSARAFSKSGAGRRACPARATSRFAESRDPRSL